MLEHDLFFIHPDDIISDQQIILRNKTEVNHIYSVLRKKENDFAYLSDGIEYFYFIQFNFLSKREITARVIDRHPIQKSPYNIQLNNSLLKGSTFDLQLEKAIEIGVDRIQPLLTDHVIANKSKVEKWRDTIRTASKQSKHVQTIEIFEPLKVLSLKKKSDEHWLVPEIGAQTVPFDSITPELNGKTVCVFIGPEGGFSRRELEHFKSEGATFHSLGSSRLRAETATWVALSLVHHLLRPY